MSDGLSFLAFAKMMKEQGFFVAQTIGRDDKYPTVVVELGNKDFVYRLYTAYGILDELSWLPKYEELPLPTGGEELNHIKLQQFVNKPEKREAVSQLWRSILLSIAAGCAGLVLGILLGINLL